MAILLVTHLEWMRIGLVPATEDILVVLVNPSLIEMFSDAVVKSTIRGRKYLASILMWVLDDLCDGS